MDKAAQNQALKDARENRPPPNLSKVDAQTRDSYLGNYNPKK